MGLFGIFRSKAEEASAEVSFPVSLGAPAKGTFVAMEAIPDQVFSSGILGICCGVEPQEGKVYAPVGGKITQLADTLHAVGLEAGGIEILIHVGVDTVEMSGDGFVGKVREGQIVRRGELLLTMDLDKIRAAAHPATIIMAVTNTDDFGSVEVIGGAEVNTDSDVICVRK